MLAAGSTGAPLVQADILRLPMPDASVDGVTCGFALRNLVKLAPFFAELARVVRPGGRIALLEVAENRREESFHIGHVVKHQLAHRQVERGAGRPVSRDV